jgi:hypothetical protein
MTSLTEEAGGLRTDSRGRVWVSAERRQALLEEFDQSGLSGAAFARLAGVHYQTFMNWLAARRKRAAAAAPHNGSPEPADAQNLRRAPVAFLEASLPELRSNAALSVELPGGARIEIHSPHQLALAAELLRIVSQPRPRPC